MGESGERIAQAALRLLDILPPVAGRDDPTQDEWAEYEAASEALRALAAAALKEDQHG